MGMSTLSFPFMSDREAPPWTLWTAQCPITTLVEPSADLENIPCPNAYADIEENAKTESNMLTDYSIRRPQYTAVLNRMNKANRKTGTFTAWITS